MKQTRVIALLFTLFIMMACDTITESNHNSLSSTEFPFESELRAPAPGSSTIADIVVASVNADDPEFTFLFAALEYAELTGVFAGNGQYTVFAPTDEAFLNLVNSLAELLDEEILENDGAFAAIDALLGEGTVANVLLYHVTNGRRAANSVVPRNPRQDRTIQTLLGESFTVNSNLKITAIGNTANILDADISASNGIIHIIDAVILPL